MPTALSQLFMGYKNDVMEKYAVLNMQHAWGRWKMHTTFDSKRLKRTTLGMDRISV
jgi:hypothetical protein